MTDVPNTSGVPRALPGRRLKFDISRVCPGYPLEVIGVTKGKSGIHLERVYAGEPADIVGQRLARGYFASNVGRDEEVIRNFIRNQG
jgi:hypothetical protein